MPKQNTANHTPAKQFRLGQIADARLNEIADHLGVDRTTALKLAIQDLHVRMLARKNPKKSDLPS